MSVNCRLNPLVANFELLMFTLRKLGFISCVSINASHYIVGNVKC